ncbi:MAG: 50S ribosomal protein L15 [Bdellovibrionales bacterium]
MSLLSSLRPKKGSTHSRRRVGRGDGSGWGGTAAKGHKGQKARAGGGIRLGFEGGQMPLVRRLPKFGFTNAKFKKTYDLVSLEQLNKFDGDVTLEVLREAGLVHPKGKVKVLVKGELTKAVNVTVHKISASAKKAIEDKGGKVEVI